MSPTAPSFTSIDYNHEVETNTTLILYWFTQYFASSTTFWYLMLAMDLISSLSNPFLPFQSNSLIHHMLAWPLAGVWCVLYDIAVYQQPKSVPEVHLRMVGLLPLYGSLIYILFALHAAEARSRQLTTTTHATTLRMAKLIVPYLVVFGASGMAHMGIFVADLYNGKPTGYSSYIDQLVGIVSTMVLFVRFYFDSGVCRRRTVNAPPNQSEGDLSTVVSPQDDNFSDYLRTTASPSEAPPLPRVQSTTNFNVDIAAELRKMVMDLTRMGIVSAAASEVSDDEPSVVSDRAPTAPDFTAVERKRITFWGGTAATVADALVFEDVAPTVFHSLRELAGIGQASYLHSFDSDENLREVCSEGKSGNIFYFTEFDTLRSILPEYYTYLVQNPSSHLCRYFGCHSITLPVGTRRMYFVVMQNLFIEGVALDAIPSWDVEAKMHAAVMRKKIAKLMMDIDFSRIHQCISVSDADSTAVKTQLKRDIQFLAGLHIMDYSRDSHLRILFRMVEIPALLDATLVVVAVVVLLASTAHFTYHPRTRAYPGPVLIFILFSSGMGILLRSAMHLAAINIAFPTDREPSDGASPPVPLTLVDVAHAALMQASVLPIRVSIPFWAMLYFTSAATFWYLMLAMDLISSLSNPFLPFQANNILHHVVTWPAASAWVAAFYLFFRTDAESATPTTSLRMWMILPMYVVMAYITIALFVTWRKSRTLETQAHTTTRRMAKQIMPYLFVFGLGGLVDICLYAAEVHIETVTGYRSWPVNIMHQITQVVQVVAVLMLFQRKAGWVLCWRRRTTVASLQAVAQLSPCASPMDDTQRATEDDDRLSGEDLSVSNVMRQCIMKYTSMGIIESAQSAVAKAPADITLEDYTVVENKIVIVHGEMDSAILTFRDCAPAVFQHIRSMCGISQADYVNSFALDRNMNEHGSEGKSGNLFYFTGNHCMKAYGAAPTLSSLGSQQTIYGQECA
ncbi:hypothetical protein DYB32_008685 [Aphanomyces invadans]|uniref:PIPK domain-containing protein n=1 Tax=Aphanomyces invadans TaxID=157072 RepID=A0A3R7CV28_9STRA|nr:hypothetical protein DYB32_008685 [Aphanomyces invadans]